MWCILLLAAMVAVHAEPGSIARTAHLRPDRQLQQPLTTAASAASDSEPMPPPRCIARPHLLDGGNSTADIARQLQGATISYGGGALLGKYATPTIYLLKYGTHTSAYISALATFVQNLGASGERIADRGV